MKRILASVATAALALGGLVATAMPASAHTPNVHSTCDSLSLNLTQYVKGHRGDKNTVTVSVDGKKVLRQDFDRSFTTTVKLDGTGHDWVVEIDAWDGEKGKQFDEIRKGTTEPCAAAPALETGLYLYEKKNPEQDASWDNSGPQTFVTSRPGGEYLTELPVEELPTDVCGPAWGVQQDVVRLADDFAWPETIEPPVTKLSKWLVKAKHQNLSDLVTVPDCHENVPTPVELPAPTPVEVCDAEPSVTLPESTVAEYAEQWDASRTQVTVIATPVDGEQFPEGTQTEWTFTFGDLVCDTDLPVVSPSVPAITDLCGTENDLIELPADTDEVTYESTTEGFLAHAAEGFTLGDLPAEYTSVDATTALYTVTETTLTDEACELVPGDIGAVCDASSPYLVYGVSLPESSEVEGDNPLTITFLNPDGADHVTTGLPLEGRLLWPGASDEEPLQWPGWEQLEDGTYAETDGNFAWTRDGVQVLFEVNPDYSTVVNYPPASEDCVDAPSNVRGPAAQTVVDVPEDGSGADDGASGEDELALTGATVGIAAAVALLLVAGGVTLFVVRRRLQHS
ncbi:hypothetical protein [Isoptericola croceus]|uniref:hypothetical protein n=1 Tax=Isoptericola croceus TaxID=3031406 RepID=UPI0023F75BD6|nr:hypothetical protein [Isoptericola croceus]